jgi:hypothetical protein
MSADHRQPSALAGAAHDLGDGARRQTAVRRAHAREHEHRPAARAAAREPAGQRLTNVGGQRQALLAAALAADQHLGGAPVDIAKPQRGDLASAQAEP